MHILFLQSSFDKTAPNIQRRILKLMKSPQSQMTVKICSAECAHDEVSILRVILKQGEAGFRQCTGKGRSSTRLQLQYSPTHVDIFQSEVDTNTNQGGWGWVNDVRVRVQQAVSCFDKLNQPCVLPFQLCVLPTSKDNVASALDLAKAKGDQKYLILIRIWSYYI